MRRACGDTNGWLAADGTFWGPWFTGAGNVVAVVGMAPVADEEALLVHVVENKEKGFEAEVLI